MKVLVTGHRGYIGTVMVPMPLEAGHAVTGCDSDLYRGCSFEAGGAIVAVPNLHKDVRDVTARDLIVRLIREETLDDDLRYRDHAATSDALPMAAA